MPKWCEPAMSDGLSPDAILAAVEKGIRGMLAGGLVIDVSPEDAATLYLAKAANTSDPDLAAGYRKLAKKAKKTGRE